MAISLGARISGLLIVGAVAVGVAAFTGDGRGVPDAGGGGSTIVTAGPSAELPAHRPSATATSPAPPRQSPDGHARAPQTPAPPAATPPVTRRAATPTPSATPRLLAAPAWLPPGPASPNADGTPDPSSVYDLLRSPDRCRAALDLIPPTADPEWRLLRGLASACLAVQGQGGGGWDTAARAYADLKPETCKGRAVHAVLGTLLDFHRRHPGATVRLASAPDGTRACAYGVLGVDTGGDGRAEPGETVGIELTGTYFDHAELLRYGSVFIGGGQLAGPPVPRSRAGDTIVLSAVVPALDAYPKTVDVTVRYAGTEARLKNAFTVVAPTAAPPSPPDQPTLIPLRGLPAGPRSGPPQGMLPFGPLPGDRARP
ncbi:hypothetical protein ACYF6T_35675 [Streptomyces sp. 7R007]